MSSPSSREAETGAAVTAQGATLILGGAWTTRYLGRVALQIDRLLADSRRDAAARFDAPRVDARLIDASRLTAFDTGGAWVLHGLLRRLEAAGHEARIEGLKEEYRALLDLIRGRAPEPVPETPPARTGFLHHLGRNAMMHLAEAHAMTAFIGQVAVALFEHVKRPKRLRFGAFVGTLESAGIGAIPIVALLSFLLGIVIAYQGGLQLQSYGANVFIAELVSLTMFREFGPMMTAIIVAGRTGSAYTAEIGTMKVTDEIDALESIGIPPLDLLVLPKLFGLVVAVPLLTLVADVAGVFGGMAMAAAMLDVGFEDFVKRLPQPLVYRSFLIGIAKAPVFALIVATVGCFQGFRVSGSADSVGRKTTASVVQSIFLVIVADAVFSILFSFIRI